MEGFYKREYERTRDELHALRLRHREMRHILARALSHAQSVYVYSGDSWDSLAAILQEAAHCDSDRAARDLADALTDIASAGGWVDRCGGCFEAKNACVCPTWDDAITERVRIAVPPAAVTGDVGQPDCGRPTDAPGVGL